MGVSDRDYMRDKRRPLTPTEQPALSHEPKSDLSWWDRLRFKLWLLFHPGRKP